MLRPRALAFEPRARLRELRRQQLLAHALAAGAQRERQAAAGGRVQGIDHVVDRAIVGACDDQDAVAHRPAVGELIDLPHDRFGRELQNERALAGSGRPLDGCQLRAPAALSGRLLARRHRARTEQRAMHRAAGLRRSAGEIGAQTRAELPANLGLLFEQRLQLALQMPSRLRAGRIEHDPYGVDARAAATPREQAAHRRDQAIERRRACALRRRHRRPTVELCLQQLADQAQHLRLLDLRLAAQRREQLVNALARDAELVLQEPRVHEEGPLARAAFRRREPHLGRERRELLAPPLRARRHAERPTRAVGELEAQTGAQETGELAARQVHDREREQVGHLALADVAAPVLQCQPALEEGRELGIERLAQRAPPAEQALERGIERELEVLLPHARRVETQRRRNCGCAARLRSSRERLFQLQRSQPVAQDLVGLGSRQEPRARRLTRCIHARALLRRSPARVKPRLKHEHDRWELSAMQNLLTPVLAQAILTRSSTGASRRPNPDEERAMAKQYTGRCACGAVQFVKRRLGWAKPLGLTEFSDMPH